MLVYKALHGLPPKYISDLLLHYERSRPLRLSGAGLLTVKTKHGEAAFAEFEAPINKVACGNRILYTADCHIWDLILCIPYKPAKPSARCHGFKAAS